MVDEPSPSSSNGTSAETSTAADRTPTDRMFDRILAAGDGVFYRSQQRGENDLTAEDKATILRELFDERPVIFLERYYHYIGQESLGLFPSSGDADGRVALYTAMIRDREQSTVAAEDGGRRRVRGSQPATATETRNRRYAELLRLRDAGSYFSNARMRERAPLLFDSMVGRYLDDSEKLHLRPTMDLRLANEAEKSQFTSLLEQFDDTQRIADRRNAQAESAAAGGSGGSMNFSDRFFDHVEHRTCEADVGQMAAADDFEMEFDSSDEEGRQLEAARQNNHRLRRRRNFGALADEPPLMRRERRALRPNGGLTADSEDQNAESAFSALKVSRPKAANGVNGHDEAADQTKETPEEEEWSSGDEDEKSATGILKEQLHDEFVSIMEQRFLAGQDAEFFDYVRLDSEAWSERNAELNRIREQDLEDVYFADD